MNAAGIDVSSRKSTVAVLRPFGEVVKLPFDVTHSAEGLAALVQQLKSIEGETRVVMEHTGRYYEPVAQALHTAGFYVSAVNPLLIKEYGGNSLRRVKTDKADAMKIARYALDNWSELRDYTPMEELCGATILLSEHRFHYVRDSFDRLVFMEDGEITSIYSRSEALSLTEAQLTAMGLRPFQPPSFQVGGAFLSKPEDTFQASQISCMLDGRQIIEDVTFSSQSGKTLAIAGPNGAGKSTLCRTITGLYRSMGTIQIDGEYLKRKRRTKKSFFVQQDADYQLYAPTVVDEFLIGKKETPELRQAALARLNEMGLEPFAVRHPASLSGGQKQRLLLALAAESGRDLLVFDEPTSGLDGYNMRLTVKLLRQLAAAGKCLLLITHDMDLIAAAADCVLYLEQGKLRYHRNVLRDK